MIISDDVRNLNPEIFAGGDRPLKLSSARQRRAAKSFGVYDSHLELDFAYELTARRLKWAEHPFTYHLPGGVDYTPDFISWERVGDFGNGERLTVYEVKGQHVKNTRDSRTRFRIAAGLHRYARFVWVTRRKGLWVEEVYEP